MYGGGRYPIGRTVEVLQLVKPGGPTGSDRSVGSTSYTWVLEVSLYLSHVSNVSPVPLQLTGLLSIVTNLSTAYLLQHTGRLIYCVCTD